MKKPLKRSGTPALYHYDSSGNKVDGAHERLRGNCGGLCGNCGGLYGNCSGLYGDCTGLRGDCAGLYGYCTGLCGDFVDAGISETEGRLGVNIQDLVK